MKGEMKLKKCKRLLAVLIAVLMVGALFACSSGDEEESVASSDTAATTETGDEASEAVEATEETGTEVADKITLFQSKTEITDQLAACVEAFAAETGIEVEIWETSGDEYYTDCKLYLTSDEGPTIFSISPGSQVAELNAYLTDLSDTAVADLIYEDMRVEYDGVLVGVPYTVEGFGLLIDESMVTDADIADLASFEAYMAACADAGTNGMELSEESYFLIGHILNTPFALQDDPDAYLASVLAGETRFVDNATFVEFGELYDAIRTYAQSPLGVSYDEACGDFATGATGIIHQGNWCYSMFADYDVTFDMALAPLPIAGNDGVAVAVPTAWAVNSQASDEEIAAAKVFLDWLYTSDTGKSYMMDEFGFIPVVEGMTSETLDPISQSVADYVAAGKTIVWSLNDWPAGIITTYLQPVAEEFFTSDMTVTEFLDALNDAFVEAAS